MDSPCIALHNHYGCQELPTNVSSQIIYILLLEYKRSHLAVTGISYDSLLQWGHTGVFTWHGYHTQHFKGNKRTKTKALRNFLFGNKCIIISEQKRNIMLPLHVSHNKYHNTCKGYTRYWSIKDKPIGHQIPLWHFWRVVSRNIPRAWLLMYIEQWDYHALKQVLTLSNVSSKTLMTIACFHFVNHACSRLNSCLWKPYPEGPRNQFPTILLSVLLCSKSNTGILQ